MATAATTIHKALIASPRRNATTPRAHAPTIASTSQGKWRSGLLLFFILLFQPGWTRKTAIRSLALLAPKATPHVGLERPFEFFLRFCTASVQPLLEALNHPGEKAVAPLTTRRLECPCPRRPMDRRCHRRCCICCS
ncbi:hypothetical protein EMIT048CA2_70121 [Pseudomonas chlororaphis]